MMETAMRMTILVVGFASLLLLLWRSVMLPTSPRFPPREMTMTILVGGFASLLLLLWRSVMLPTSPRFPPGERPLPIVGNWLTMMKSGSIQNFAKEMTCKYGPIVTLWVCSEPVVIISEPDIIQEAMIRQGSVFMGRQQLQSTSVLNRGHRGVLTGDGERHRFFRKLLVSEVFSNKRVREFRPIRDKEVEILVESLKKQLDDEKGGRVVTNFRSIIRLTIFNFLMGILFGRRLTQNEYAKLDELMVQRFKMAVGELRDYIPWLALLPDRNGVKVQLEMMENISRILKPLIDERKQALLLSRKKEDQQTPLVDTLLRLQSGETNESSIDISDADVEVMCLDILNAGTDTTAITLEYCIANLINHPEIQERVAQEITAVVGERVVNEDDIPRLPYLQAVVKEALRRHSPARLAPSRKTLLATKLAGFDIPINTQVMQNLEAVALSPKIWEDPLEFRPERHLNKPLDITGSSQITMIPFGVGRRNCPAINIAFLNAEFTLARLIQAFEWKSATPGKLLDLAPGLGLTAPMCHPPVARIRERLMVS